MSTPPAGFREIEHTADWELFVWGPDLHSLFEQSAMGMYDLCGAHWLEAASVKKVIKITAIDNESLLVCFLSELLYYYEKDGLGFKYIQIKITGSTLQAELEGKAITALDKEIKAVTYHNLKIRQTRSGWEANIVFDV